jgi:hypothetical protein
LLPASLSGVDVPRSGSETTALALQPAGTLTVRPFLDSNSNGLRESDEPTLSGGSATINGLLRSFGVNGATFSLPPGSYPVTMAPPAGYATVWAQPIGPVVMTAAAQTLWLPLRDASGISGKVWPPNPNSFSLGSGSLAAGLTVQLQDIATSATVETTSGANGSFSFSHLPPAPARAAARLRSQQRAADRLPGRPNPERLQPEPGSHRPRGGRSLQRQQRQPAVGQQ